MEKWQEKSIDNRNIIDYGSIRSDQFSESGSINFELSADEDTPLIGSTTTTTHAPNRYGISTSMYQSVAKYTTSNYFGFGSISYTVAKMKEKAMVSSKTVSLIDIPSFDRMTPTLVAFFTELSFITGLSVFAIPLVVAKCGIPMVVAIALAGLILWYSAQLINKCQYQTSKTTGKSKRIYENYIDLGKAVIKWKGESLMKLLVGSSVLTDIYSLIFCAQISKDLSQGHFDLDSRIWMLIWMTVAFPLFFIRKMSVLAWLGFFSLVFYVSGLVGIFGLLIYHHDQWNWGNLTPDDFKISYVFIGYGIIVNSYNLHISIPAVEASMKKSTSFTKINVIAFAINTLLKIFLALTVVATFGINVQGSALTNFAIYGQVALIINVLIGLYMITQYPTSLFVVLEMLDVYALPKFTVFKKDHWTEWIWMFLSRLLLTVFIAFVAVSIPNFEMVTGFIGNIRGTLATIVLPIYFYIRLHERYMTLGSKIFHWFLIALVSLLGLAGATCSILGMLGYIY